MTFRENFWDLYDHFYSAFWYFEVPTNAFCSSHKSVWIDIFKLLDLCNVCIFWHLEACATCVTQKNIIFRQHVSCYKSLWSITLDLTKCTLILNVNIGLNIWNRWLRATMLIIVTRGYLMPRRVWHKDATCVTAVILIITQKV